MGAHSKSGQAGQTLPLTAILMVAIVPIVAFALNVGIMSDAQTSGQNGTDAVALAAAEMIRSGAGEEAASAMASRVAQDDGLNPATLTVTYLASSGEATTTASQVAFVDVKATVTRNAILGTFLGIKWDSVTTSSDASVGNPGPACGMCVLSPSASPALSVTGNSTITVQSGPIAVDSSASDAMSMSGNATVGATAINIVGACSGCTGANVSVTPSPTTGTLRTTDPLADTPAPSISGTASAPASSGTIYPGMYTSISVGSNQTLALAPGVYVIEGGMTLSGNAQLDASGGVTLYFTCSTYAVSDTEPSCAGTNGISIGANATVDLVAPASGVYQGISMMVDPNDPNSISIGGNGTDTLSGTVYAAASSLNVSGNGSGTTLNSIFIVSTLALSGNSSLDLASTQAANAPGVYQNAIPHLVSAT